MSHFAMLAVLPKSVSETADRRAVVTELARLMALRTGLAWRFRSRVLACLSGLA